MNHFPASCLLSLGSLLAQEAPPPQRFAAQRAELVANAKLQLESKDIVQVAWGAYAVAEFRLQECVPDVRAVLGDRPWRDAASDRCATLALLDALIQTDAVVPAAELAPHVRDGAPVIVLMAREPEAYRDLLRRAFLPATKTCDISVEQIACGNMLARLRDPEFVRAALRLRSQIWLSVCDPGGEVDPDAGFMTGNACYRFTSPKDFPPIARHELHLGASWGRVVAPGANPVHATRSFYRAGQLHCTSLAGYSRYRDARQAWFLDLLGEAGKPLVEALDRPRVVEWTGDEPFRTEVAACRRDYEERWRALAAFCVAQKLVEMDPATESVPPVRIVGMDLRADPKSLRHGRRVACPFGSALGRRRLRDSVLGVLRSW